MALVEQAIVRTVRYEFRLSGAEDGGRGVPVGEVEKAIEVARKQFLALQKGCLTILTDDWLKCYAVDDTLVFWFDITETKRS